MVKILVLGVLFLILKLNSLHWSYVNLELVFMKHRESQGMQLFSIISKSKSNHKKALMLIILQIHPAVRHI